MARIHTVQKSNKAHVCGHGGHEIPKGQAYTWAKPGYRTRTPLIRCTAHPFRPSELTTSMASAPMAAQEAFEDALESIDLNSDDCLDEMRSALEEFQSEVRSYADERRAAFEAWENGNATLEELAETAEAAASEVENAEVEDWDEEEPGDAPERPAFESEEEWEDAVAEHEQEVDDYAERKAAHRKEQRDALSEMSAGLEF